MRVDQTGTAPGLTSEPADAPKINIRCKNPDCDSIVAIELKLSGQEPGHRLYQCCKCKVTRGIAVGGRIQL